jgi:hypothetical protein
MVRWYITQHAVDRYVHAMRWPGSDASWERAESALPAMCAHATYRATDRQSREEWRSSAEQAAAGCAGWSTLDRTRAGSRPPRLWDS